MPPRSVGTIIVSILYITSCRHQSPTNDHADVRAGKTPARGEAAGRGFHERGEAFHCAGAPSGGHARHVSQLERGDARRFSSPHGGGDLFLAG